MRHARMDSDFLNDRIRFVPENKGAVLSNRLRVLMFKGNYQGVEYAAALIVADADRCSY
jgi:hypothetical protein